MIWKLGLFKAGTTGRAELSVVSLGVFEKSILFAVVIEISASLANASWPMLESCEASVATTREAGVNTSFRPLAVVFSTVVIFGTAVLMELVMLTLLVVNA